MAQEPRGIDEIRRVARHEAEQILRDVMGGSSNLSSQVQDLTDQLGDWRRQMDNRLGKIEDRVYG